MQGHIASVIAWDRILFESRFMLFIEDDQTRIGNGAKIALRGPITTGTCPDAMRPPLLVTFHVAHVGYAEEPPDRNGPETDCESVESG